MPAKRINKVPAATTDDNDVPSVFMLGATYVLQKQLESLYGNDSYVDNHRGLRGYLTSADNLQLEALMTILNKYEFHVINYL